MPDVGRGGGVLRADDSLAEPPDRQRNFASGGIKMRFWQAGHCVYWPSSFAGTCRAVLQRGQVTLMAAIEQTVRLTNRDRNTSN